VAEAKAGLGHGTLWSGSGLTAQPDLKRIPKSVKRFAEEMR